MCSRQTIQNPTSSTLHDAQSKLPNLQNRRGRRKGSKGEVQVRVPAFAGAAALAAEWEVARNIPSTGAPENGTALRNGTRQGDREWGCGWSERASGAGQGTGCVLTEHATQACQAEKQKKKTRAGLAAQRTARTIISPCPGPVQPAELAQPAPVKPPGSLGRGRQRQQHQHNNTPRDHSDQRAAKAASKQRSGCGRSSLLPRPSSPARGSTGP